MLIIEHRCNDIETLKKVPVEYGCEIDIRNHGKKLIVTHDAFNEDGEDLGLWLKNFQHKFLIVNVKEEGLEEEVIKLLKLNKVLDFFILDESFPFIRKWALNGVEEFAVRVSEYESYKTAINLAFDLAKQKKRIEWVWVDCFKGGLLPAHEHHILKNTGFKLCYVSPELHFLENPECWSNKVIDFISALGEQGVTPDAICTKLSSVWRSSHLYAQ